MSEPQNAGSGGAGESRPVRLRDALRQARIEAADRTGVVVDLRDAEVARLEISTKRWIRYSDKSPTRSTCSIAASARAIHRGFGSMWSPM